MTALAPTLQAFFTDRLIRQRQASPHTIAAYRDTWRLLLGYASRQSGKPPARWTWRPGRAADRRVPRPPRNQPGQQRPDPQRPAGRHPLAVPLRGAAPPRARPDDRPGAGHPAQTPRQGPGHLAHRTRDRRPARRPGPLHLDRAARPRDDPARRPDRAARLRTHRTDHRRCPPRHRGARLLHRQGPQTADHPADHRHRRRAAGLAGRTRRQPGQPLFPTRTGSRLSRDAIEHRLAKHAATAAARCPSLRSKTITAHALRHTAPCACCTPGSTPR